MKKLYNWVTTPNLIILAVNIIAIPVFAAKFSNHLKNHSITTESE